jgi:RluA family pseudouridine synthase
MGRPDKHVFVVSSAEVPTTLQQLLCRRLGLSPEEAADWIGGGSIYLEGKRQRSADLPLGPGARVVAFAPELARAEDAEPRVAFEDGLLAVIDKPAGMPSTPTRRGGAFTLEDYVRARWGVAARVMHRLDRGVSGLLLVSLRGEARRFLAQQVQDRRLHRRYLALAEGVIDAPELVIRSRLSSGRGRVRSSQDPRARPAETRVTLLWSTAGPPRRSLLAVELTTGRTHQIRAHLGERGLPILGDRRYGARAGGRIALHAHCLGLVHPRGGRVEIHSPLPEELRGLIPEGGGLMARRGLR